MKPPHRPTLIAIVLVATIGGLALALPRGARAPSVHAPSAPTSALAATVVSEPKEVAVMTHGPGSVVWPDLDVFARLGAEETMGAIGVELERVQSFVESTPIPAAVPRPSVPVGVSSGGAGGGGHSDAWWQGVAMCEQGGNNHPYYGYLSFMDGSQGGKPWDEQVAAANDLIARYPGAWAQACVDAGYRASPSG